MKNKRTLMFAALLLSLPGVGADYHVSPRGADSSPGTITRPFRTIQRAADIVHPGDTVIVEDGIYSNPLASGADSTLVNVTHSGTANAYIVFRAQHKWGAVLDGLNNTTAEGWGLAGNYIRIEDFEMKDFSDDALSNYKGGRFITIAGNDIHDIGRYCTDTDIGRVGIFLSNSSITIERNVIRDIGRYAEGENGCRPANTHYQGHDHGIYVAGASDVMIRNNVFYNIRHGWSIQVYPKTVDHLAVLNNTFAYPNPWYTGHIIIAAPVTNSRIENNIFYEPNHAAIYFNPSDGLFPANDTLSIRNNISTNVMLQLYILKPERLLTDFSAPGITCASNREKVDPLFANPAVHDFQLTSRSPAVGTGSMLPDVPNDYKGAVRANPPSIGAFEYAR
jgi:hypothetical protein